MDQIHTRLTVEQVKVLLEEYRWGLLNRSAMGRSFGHWQKPVLCSPK